MASQVLNPGKPISVSSLLPSLSPTPLEGEHTDVSIPEALLKGMNMLKISEKKQRRILFRIDPDEGQIIYVSKKTEAVAFESIKEIRTGAGARYHREQFSLPKNTEERWITIIYILEGTYRTLHMIADTIPQFKMWDNAIRKLLAIRQGLMTGLGNTEVREIVWERQYWKAADIEGDKKLSFEEVERLCLMLNAQLSPEELWKRFSQADKGNKGYLDFTGFQAFVKVLKDRPEIAVIYEDLCDAHAGKFDYSAFESFMRHIQRSGLSDDELKTVFDKYASPPQQSQALSITSKTTATPDSSSSRSSQETKPEMTSSPVLTLDGFSLFLTSSDNAVFSEHDRSIWQDMTRPISEYFISSSHNTYLVGHQLIGVSTVEGYIRALLHSCRSVELDIYDGETEPVVFHGRTLTSKVSVRDICHAIAKYAFVTSPYPVLISAEVHCGVKQQDLLVDIMIETFGDSLVRAPVEGRPKISVLPSPEDLKGKILLKAKNLYVTQLEELKNRVSGMPNKPPPELDADGSSESTDESEDEGGTRDIITGELQTGIKELKEKWRHLRGASSKSASASKLASGITGSKPKVKMSFSLASLLVYTVGVKCRGFGAGNGYAPEHVFSLSESKANKFLKVQSTMGDLVKHTKGHMVRVYPKGTRVNSTNYDPHRYWAVGAQIVAINWQTFDLGYTMNQAMFQRNGRSGYVLKPEGLRAKEDLLPTRSKHVLDVTIISAHQLPRLKDSMGREIIEKSIVDPLVQVSLHIPDWTHPPFALQSSTVIPSASTLPGDPETQMARIVSQRTHVVKNNGFNPIWHETLNLPFDVAGGREMTELIFVQFSVLENDHDREGSQPIATYCTPLACLEQGYRHLPLHDSQFSQYLFSTLFIQVQIRNA